MGQHSKYEVHFFLPPAFDTSEADDLRIAMAAFAVHCRPYYEGRGWVAPAMEHDNRARVSLRFEMPHQMFPPVGELTGLLARWMVDNYISPEDTRYLLRGAALYATAADGTRRRVPEFGVLNADARASFLRHAK